MLEDRLPIRVVLEGPAEDGSWGIDVTFADGWNHGLTAGADFYEAIHNALESWPEELGPYIHQEEI